MRKPLSPKRRAYLKRGWLAVMPFHLGGLGLFVLGCAGFALVRLLHGAEVWVWLGIGAELAGAVLMFLGIARFFAWARTAPFEQSDDEGAS